MPRRLGTRGGKDGDWEDIRGSKGMTQKKEVVVITEEGGGALGHNYALVCIFRNLKGVGPFSAPTDLMCQKIVVQ